MEWKDPLLRVRSLLIFADEGKAFREEVGEGNADFLEKTDISGQGEAFRGRIARRESTRKVFVPPESGGGDGLRR